MVFESIQNWIRHLCLGGSNVSAEGQASRGGQISAIRFYSATWSLLKLLVVILAQLVGYMLSWKHSLCFLHLSYNKAQRVSLWEFRKPLWEFHVCTVFLENLKDYHALCYTPPFMNGKESTNLHGPGPMLKLYIFPITCILCLSNTQKLIDDNSKSFESFTDSVAQLFLACLLSFVWRIFFPHKCLAYLLLLYITMYSLIAVWYEVI